MAIDWALVGWSAKALAGVARKLHAEGAVWRVREIAMVGVAKQLHVNVLHRIRKLGLGMQDWHDRDSDAAMALEISSECRKTMGALLELRPNELHCCMKTLLHDGGNPSQDRVGTWVRSEPLDTRPVESGNENAHLVSKNSVWSALLGRSDGVTHWKPFSCFACNDLAKHPQLFQCDRAQWAQYYRSALVFPIRYPKNVQANEFGHIGFLAFDSMKVGAFRGLPDIFQYRDDPTAYRQLLEATTPFHIGSIMADTLGACLRPIYERRQDDGTNDSER